MLVAGSEPPALRAVATKVTNYPELYGVDVFWYAHKRKVGVQRKEVKDLLASVNDGRLVKELGQMGSLDYRYLIVEGPVTFSNDGVLLSNVFGQRWTWKQWNGLLLSIMDRKVNVIHTKSLTDTVEYVKMMEQWFTKSRHTSLSTRPSVGKGLWGTGPSHREFATWFLQGIPGVGVELAERIFDKFGLCLELKVDEAELQTVQGLGKVKAKGIVDIFKADEAETNSEG